MISSTADDSRKQKQINMGYEAEKAVLCEINDRRKLSF
jgi:hypothetical protein